MSAAANLANTDDVNLILKKSGLVMLDRKQTRLVSDNFTDIQNAISKTSVYLANIAKLQAYNNETTGILAKMTAEHQAVKPANDNIRVAESINELGRHLGELQDRLDNDEGSNRSWISNIGGLLKLFKGRFGKILGIAGVGLDIGSRLFEGQSLGHVAVGVGSGLAGAWAGAEGGAAAGAAIGSLFGGVGAAPGALIGGALGSVGGYFGGEKIGDTAYDYVNKPPAASDPNSFSSKFETYLAGTFSSVNSWLEDHIPGLRAMENFAGGLAHQFENGFNYDPSVKPAGDSDNANYAMQFFQSKGFSRVQAAGIVGNFQQESGPKLKVDARNPSSHMYGIAQWDTRRRATFARVMGKPIEGSTLQDQLNFVMWELANTHKKAYTKMMSVDSSAEAAMTWVKWYEGAVGQNDDKRVANARHLAGADNAKTFGERAGELARDAVDWATGKGSDAKPDAQRVGASGVESNDIRNYVQLKNSHVHLDLLTSDTYNAFAAMAKEYHDATGGKIFINSAGRTRAEQEYEYRTQPRGRAARPGHSKHEQGLALDIHGPIASQLAARGLLAKYGFGRPVPREPWHIQLMRPSHAKMANQSTSNATQQRKKPSSQAQNIAVVPHPTGIKKPAPPKTTPAPKSDPTWAYLTYFL